MEHTTATGVTHEKPFEPTATEDTEEPIEPRGVSRAGRAVMETTLSWIRESVSVPEWAPGYGREDARSDLIAGLTVGVMLIPQGMAYAVLAGMPPIYGLYASLVPLLVYPLLGSSRHLASGVTAVDMIIVAAGVGGLSAAGTGRYVELAILAALMVGALQLGMAALRLGFLANLLSRPVIAGFASAAGIIIVFSQAQNLLGIELPRSEYFYVVILEAAGHLAEVHGLSVTIGAASLAAIVLLRYWKSVFPSELLVMLVATILVWALDLDRLGVQVVGEIPTGLPGPQMPELTVANLRDLLPTAVTLALVQFMSVVSLGRIFAARHGYSIDANRELLAVGAANVVGSLFRCIPAAGSFSRSAVNEQAGARSPMANVVAAGLVGLTLLFLTPLFHRLPMPALGAIIVVAAVGLVDVAEVRYLFRTKRIDGWVAVFTFGATLTLGIEEGLLLGIAAAVVAILYRQSRPHVAELGHLSATRSFKNLERFAKAYPIQGLMILRIEAGFSFVNASFLKEFILEKAAEGHVRAVILDAGSINDLDTTALEAIEEVTETLEERGIDIHFAGLTGPIRDVMERAGLDRLLGPDRFHMTPHRAVRHVLEGWDEAEGTRRLELYERSTKLDEEEVEPTADTDLT